MNSNFSKTTILSVDAQHPGYIINNFSDSGTTTDWSFGGTFSLSNGVVTMEGVNPAFSSVNFTVGANDIICVEFKVSLPTPSTSSGSAGVYIGASWGQAMYTHQFNINTKVWTQDTATGTNEYFLNAYNSTTQLYQKHYILGTAVSLSDVPWGETTQATYPPKAIQLTGSQTTIKIRSGYNTNTSMVIKLSDFKIYNINHEGFVEPGGAITAKIGSGWSNATEFYEF